MPDFKQISVEERPYLYQERTCSMDPSEISAAMGECFGAVYGLIQSKNIKSADGALSIYYTFNPDQMTFRAGFFVSSEDADKAAGDTRADVTPAGRVIHFTHKGPYATLRDDYAEMMNYIDAEGLTLGAPTWEVYVNEPSQVTEDDLITEVYVALA